MSLGHEARRGEAAGAEAPAVAAGKRSLIASRYPALAQALGDRGGGVAGEPTIHDAATAAVENKGGGAAVDAGVAARVGAHLGADFSGVRVHSDPLAQQATAAMGARAFAYGGDVFLGAGESGGDVGLMAHELTHVAQQGAAGQRTVQRRVQVGDADSPAEREADQVAAQVTGGQGQPASLLVDDGPVQPGQMLKSQFLEQLRAEVTAAADAELGPIYSAIGCPHIEQYFGRYAGQPAAAGEALVRRYAPATRTARAAVDMIPAVVARVREGVRAWRETGEAPPDLTAMAPAAASSGAEAGPVQAQAQRAPDGGETLGSLEAELGPGQPLDGATASRMSDALGADVSAARIHTGPVAARKASDAGALAFAVGPNVVMGAGAPRAGTLEGDALLAHELAHTAQQAGAAADPVARRQPIGAESAAAEEHADAAAAGALAQLHGTDRESGARGGLVQRFGGALKTGLQLQRCNKNNQQQQPPQLTQQQQAARTTLQHLATLAEADFRREIAAMTRQQTEDLLNNIAPADRQTHAALISRIRNERLVSTAEGLDGDLYWAGNSGADPNDQFRIKTQTQRRRNDDLQDGIHGNQSEQNTNDFAAWVRGGPAPTDTSRMNCWEMVMYAGWSSGVITRQWIFDTHTQAAAAGQGAATQSGSAQVGLGAYSDVIGNRLNLGAAVPYVAGTAPPRGNLVFFNGIAHVALSTGNLVNGEAEVMSLWIVPTDPNLMLHSATQRTTIEAIKRGKGVLEAPDPRVSNPPTANMTVTHAPNPWR